MRRYLPVALSLASLALVLYRIRSAVYSAPRLSPLRLRAAASSLMPPRTYRIHRPGAWCVRRSGIKEEESAIGRHGGQPRSRTHQVPGRTQTLVPNPHAFERKKDRWQIQGERNFFKRTVLGLVTQRGAYSFANFLFLRLNYMPASGIFL
jgi:hypothetical protein